MISVQKPAPWYPINPTLVDPAWRWAYPRLRLVTPLWEAGGTPRDIVMQQRGVKQGANTFSWVRNRWGQAGDFPNTGVGTPFHYNIVGSHSLPKGSWLAVWRTTEAANNTIAAFDDGATNIGVRLQLAETGTRTGLTFATVAAYFVAANAVTTNTDYATVWTVTGNGGEFKCYQKNLGTRAVTIGTVSGIGTMVGTPTIAELGGISWTSGFSHAGTISLLVWWDGRVLSAGEAQLLLDDPFGPFRPARMIPGRVWWTAAPPAATTIPIRLVVTEGSPITLGGTAVVT